ncbi:MAG: hypothetical protein EOO14_22050, partial [Chitinophagaceae bacterium]
MKTSVVYRVMVGLLFLLAGNAAFAQEPVIPVRKRPTITGQPTSPQQTNTVTPQGNARPKSDTAGTGIETRDYSDDSLQVQVYTLSRSAAGTFDTSIRDYTSRFPIPATHVFLGNDGSATRSLLFSTPRRIGWDPGFHSNDVYKLRLEDARFYNTPRPYTELGYMLASGTEQMIDILHTQNIRPYWNAAFQYRLLGAPGTFRNQRNNHRSYQITSWYQSQNKRYNNYFVILNNKIQSGENGGIKTDRDYLNDPVFDRRLAIPTNIGGSSTIGTDLFSNNLVTGRREKEFNLLLRQQYDFGRKDSLVTDSTIIPLFYPRLRFEHTLRYGSYSYLFQDLPSASSTTKNAPDSAYYSNHYGIKFQNNNGEDSVHLEDRWREWSNDFSVYQFPDANNLQQFIKVGLELQLLHGDL